MTEFFSQKSLEYQGTEEADTINTGNLYLQDRSLNTITVYGNGGDDTLISTINYREGTDHIYGGKGDDFMVAKAQGTSQAKAHFFGGKGTDRVYLDASEIIWLEKGIDSTIVVSRNRNDGTQLTSTIKHNVEYISFTDSDGITKNYLTEDLAKGSIRAVDLEELNYRTGGENSDWFAKGLNTYSEYYSGLDLQGTNGSDYLYGTSQNDKMAAKIGADVLQGLAGNDELRAGNGRDIIVGGNGADISYGGFGRNTFQSEIDGERDKLFFKSDQFAYNYIYDSAGNNPDGAKTDMIEGLDPFDQIGIQGAENSQLSFQYINNWNIAGGTYSGIGIFVKNYIEAVYTGTNLTVAQVRNMTNGMGIDTGATGDFWTTEPGWNALWGFENRGGFNFNDYGKSWSAKAGADINAVAAFESWGGFNKGISNLYRGENIVAVLDTGIRYTHEDLRDNMLLNSGEIPNNGRDDDGNGFIDDYYGYDFAYNDGNPSDFQGHGTHVAGTIGAASNGVGVIGSNPAAKLVAVKVLDNNGSGNTAGIIKGIDYSVMRGAKILNMSLSGTGASSSYYYACKRSQDAGALIIAAAGNYSENNDVKPRYPNSFDLDGIISVGSSAPDDWKSGFSNYGSTRVDLFAPGHDIKSAGNSTDSSYTTLSGTSMATPLVAGVVSAYWARNPNLSAAQVKQDLLNSVDVIPGQNLISVTGGRMNMGKLFGVSGAASTDAGDSDSNAVNNIRESVTNLRTVEGDDATSGEPFDPDSTFLKLKDIASLDNEQLTGNFIAVIDGNVQQRSNHINEILNNRRKDGHWLEALEKFTPMRGLSNGLAVFNLVDHPDVNRREILRRLIQSDWFKGIEVDREFSVPLPTPSITMKDISGHGDNEMIGGKGDDELTGLFGRDHLSGYDGKDILRAGRGRDTIIGGAGQDVMYGGFGLNTFGNSRDGEIDQIYFRSDQWAENPLYGSAGNSPNGEKADKIEMLDEFDKIYVQGVSTSQLSFGSADHNSNLGETLTGIGIYASGVLEAVYVGDNLSQSQIASMTQGIP